MAVKRTQTLVNGLVVTDGYNRVDSIILSKSSMIIELNIYARDNPEDMPAVLKTSYSCNYNIEGENPIKQAYEYLKTLPEFADATDV
jgi:hypothetical protein